uniref:Uncharacterized protein LOC116299796 n=1 Tax=Actinia tenebrosa TaxID=6105 RepID=A0A6P8I724_ACTTE
GVNDELGVLSLNGSGHVIFDGFGEDCLTKPDRCPNGFTLSFWFKYGGLISSILGLNATYHAALDSWLLPLVPKKSRWLPCYRASQDGWTGAIFHQKCDGKSSTLTIIKVQDFVFGGYLSETWGPSKNGSIVDSKAFLFSLNNPRGTAPRKLTLIQSMFGIVNTAATTTPTSLPTFGDSDLVLKDNANTVAQSYSSPGQNYELESGLASVSQDLFTDTKYFIVDEIEVFYNEELTTDQAYILTTGAENPETTGFAIFHNQTLSNGSGDMVVKVSTEAKTWTLKATDKSKDFRPMTVTWHPTQGLKLYENTQLMASGLAVPSSNTNKKTSILLGHSESTSNPHSGQNIQIRALAIWRTVITVKDMNTYNNVACAPLTDDASNSFSWNRTVSGTPTPLTGPNTVISPARWFSSDNYINIASQSCFATVKLNLPSLNVFTACWWFRHDSAVSKYLFAIRSSSGIQLDVGAAATTTWQHFCLKHTFEQKTGCHKQLYLNGRSTSDNSYTSSCQSMAGPPITVLIGLYTTKTFDGLLSNFKLWDRHLSASEISLVSNGCSMIAGNLIVWEVLLSKFEPPVSMARDGLCKREISYIESSYPQKKGQNVRLLTSEYVPVTINCLYFQYNFYGKDIGRLNVYLLKGNSHESLVWSLAGDQGTNEWRSVYIPLNNTEKTKVIFEGIVGDGYLGDLSIGNVALTTTDSCEGGTGKNYIAVTGKKFYKTVQP